MHARSTLHSFLPSRLAPLLAALGLVGFVPAVLAQEAEPNDEAQALCAELPHPVQRRLLRFVNSRRSVEDFTRPPQDVRRRFEHALPDGDTASPFAFGSPRPARIEFDPELARLLLARRPASGYAGFLDVAVVDPDLWRKALVLILAWFDRRTYGEWIEVTPIAEDGVEQSIMHAALLHTGEVLLIPSSTDTVLWDPASTTDPITVLDGATTGLSADLFCSGHSFLSDGQLLAVGGGGGSPGKASSTQGWRFDPSAKTWTQTAGSMAYPRWYPTTVTLGYEPGQVLVASGWGVGWSPAPQMEIYSETTDSFDLVNATGPAGELLFEPTYPGLHLLPGGEIFHAPVGFENCYQSPDAGSTDPAAFFSFASSTTSGAWALLGANDRLKGMSALLLDSTYPFVRALVVGGGGLGTSGTAQTMNLSALSPSWDLAFPLLEPRVHPNVVLLPDGNVFIAGGMESTGTPPNGGRCEMYDPRSGSLAEMDELNRPRHYHSVALLLPSGQVMAAGGARAGGCSLSEENTIEVFSPPYMFATRPELTSAPSLVHHGDPFTIETPDACDVARVVLVRPMAVTHQTDSEQRVIPLPHTVQGSTTLRTSAPGGHEPHSLAPRGYYLLFLVSQDGIPSPGSWLYLH